MIEGLTEGEFLRFSSRVRHKKAARILRSYLENRKPRDLFLYRRVESWLLLPFLDEMDNKKLSDRYHLHLSESNTSLKEHNLLFSDFHQVDKESSVPYLPVAIFLDNIRSAFNVGSILRTTEAFRLGKVFFAKNTPFVDNLKVQKTSMWTFDKVPCERVSGVSTLPRPRIALETHPDAPSLFDYSFPESFTLLLGNEEYGLSEEALGVSDQIVQIPLFGFKNSLNVASAFAIAASVISHQFRN